MLRAATFVLMLALLSACSTGSGEDGGTNPTVGPTAQPEDVVRGYFQALQEDDPDAAAALSTDAFVSRDGWLDNPPGVSGVEVSNAQPDVLEGPAQQEYDDAVSLTVTATLADAGEGMVDGSTDMRATLWRGRVNDRWLIADICTLPPTDGRPGTPDDCPDLD